MGTVARRTPPARTVALALLGAAAGCGPRAASAPFGTGERAAGESPSSHSVRFQASCDECLVTWSVQTLHGTAEDKALFSESVRIRLGPGTSASASVSASPIRGEVHWVRISFDGTVVAEARAADRDTDAGGGLQVTATVGPGERASDR